MLVHVRLHERQPDVCAYQFENLSNILSTTCDSAYLLKSCSALVAICCHLVTRIAHRKKMSVCITWLPPAGLRGFCFAAAGQ